VLYRMVIFPVTLTDP